MQLDKLTNEQRIKHVYQSSPQRDGLLAVIADLEKRLKLLESRSQPTTAIFTALPPNQGKHKGDK